VVVCTYNGSRTLHDCLSGLARSEYPNYEVIVINDGSTDRTAEIAAEYDVRLLTTKNQGLSAARNEGMKAATGEIVAYLDDDAWPDPHWLMYLGTAFMKSKHAAIGGPNIPPADDSPTAYCVAHAPGGPTHVLLTDEVAEHIPGCNLAIRKPALESIEGFDPQFRVAGDDVDVCWRLQDKGWTLGFSPGAVVWHRRRASIRTYWRQQVQYGKAEALLESKWPEKYNAMGHLSWSGRLYHNGMLRVLPFRKWRVYHGVWGMGLFQSLYAPADGRIGSLLQMPESYLLVLAFALVAAVGLFWYPALLVTPLLAALVLGLVAQAVQASIKTPLPSHVLKHGSRLRWRVMLTWLHLIQPMSRLIGRLRFGLTPWRRRSDAPMALPRPQKITIWSEKWMSLEERLVAIEKNLKRLRTVVLRGDVYSRWDLEVSGGLLAGVRVRTVIEEHAQGKQLIRFAIRQTFSPTWIVLILALLAATVAAGIRREPLVFQLIPGIAGILIGIRMLLEASEATGAVKTALGCSPAKEAARPSPRLVLPPLPNDGASGEALPLADSN